MSTTPRDDAPTDKPLAKASTAPTAPRRVAVRFMELDLSMPELTASARGAALDLTDQGLGDPGLKALLSSTNTRFVTRMNLSRNSISTRGMEAFRRSSWIVNFVELNLSQNPIRDAGVKVLFESSALLSLKSLDLTDCELTDDSMAFLAEQKRVDLERLLLGNFPIELSIWQRLVDRYGDGVFAGGVHKKPYVPPFAADKLIHFSSPGSADKDDPQLFSLASASGLVPSILSFRLTDYVASLWTEAATTRHPQARGRSVVRYLKEVREIEEFFSGSLLAVHVRNGWEGFTLLSRVTPVWLRCNACQKTYEWSSAMSDAWEHGRTDDYHCPGGHKLYRVQWIP